MAIDKQMTSDSLFGNLKKKPQSTVEKRGQAIEDNILSSGPAIAEPKNQGEWEDRIILPLPTLQKEELDRVAKRMMKLRSNVTTNKSSRERITANSIIRALIGTFLEKDHSGELPIMDTEEDVKAWIRQL